MIVLGIIAVCIVGYSLIPKNNENGVDTMGVSTKLTAELITSEVKDKKAVLIDVRTEQEYAAEHAEGAINIPLASIQSNVFPEVSRSGNIYLYCRSGARAASATTLLKQAGFINVTNITSLDSWKNMGGKTE